MAEPRFITASEVGTIQGADVVGPDGSSDGNLAVFDGTDRKKLKDGGVPFTISTVLSLTPTTEPGSPTEGMVYAGTDHHLYYYNGTTWLQLDNVIV